MKNLFLIIILSFLQLSVFAQTNNGSEKLQGFISFDEFEFDAGDITQGDTVVHVFDFTNTGNAALKIDNVVTTCSCTSRKFTEGEIAPGAKGQITVTFESKDKIGRQNKMITILSNAKNKQEQIKLICNVLPN